MTSFFTELKRRNVFKVAVAYAIVAWLLIQVTDIAAPALHLPDWTVTFIIYLLIIGFPLALFLAWAYELTPEGIKATATVEPDLRITRTTGQRLNYLILGLVVLIVAFLVVDNYVLVDEPGTTTVASAAGPAVTTPVETVYTPALAMTPQPAASTAAPVQRSLIDLGETQPFPAANLDAFIALSRNGRLLVYAARTEGVNRLYSRPLDQLAASPITGTENAGDAFFSPDGKWVIYEADGGLHKVAVTGGAPQQLAGGIDLPRGAFWNEDDVIYYTVNGKLQRISTYGGTPEPVTLQPAYADWFHAWPAGLPGGTHLLLTVHTSIINAWDGRIVLLSLVTGDTQLLINNGFNARYVPTGHIVFMRSGSLWAVPFDVAQLQTAGPEVPVINGVQTSGGLGQAVYAFSDAGLLSYLPGVDVQADGIGLVQNSQLIWVDRAGNESLVEVKPDRYQTPRLSPDGRQVAIMVGEMGASQDIWTFDFARDALSRRTFSGDGTAPLWSPDGSRLAYTFFPDLKGLAWVRADGAGQPETLIDADRLLIPTSFTPDGTQLVYRDALSTISPYILTLTGERTQRQLPALASGTTAGNNHVISPDGRWLAYVSVETGRAEIFVRPFPDVEDGKWQVSTAGGEEPNWRGDGKELFYRQGQDPVTLMAVPVETGQGFQTGTPIELHQGDYYIPPLGASYDVTVDGQQFLMLKTVEETGAAGETATRQTSLVLISNWFEELKRLAPPAQ